MGQKVNPKAMRVGITRQWPSKWFARGDNYIQQVKQDLSVSRYLIKQFREAGTDKVEIERPSGKKIVVNLFTAKPGLIIGRGGVGIEELKKKLHTKFLKNFKMGEISINITEVDRPNLSAMILVQSMILEIEKRLPFKRVMKQAIGRSERSGALGVKVMLSGRLNGAEIARQEMLISGKLPLQTLRADIDYARGAAHTTFGLIGIKAWVYRGEVFERQENAGEVVKEKVNNKRK
ncbi:MAG: 30S ribosomal protein S3 [Candidatus Falkowbacteria bacterium]|nr:30S ribosomal protein S3 [Candidatus Falkowbacteria bacterium]